MKPLLYVLAHTTPSSGRNLSLALLIVKMLHWLQSIRYIDTSYVDFTTLFTIIRIFGSLLYSKVFKMSRTLVYNMSFKLQDKTAEMETLCET